MQREEGPQPVGVPDGIDEADHPGIADEIGVAALLDRPILSAVALFAGRAVLGTAESFIMTGAVAWGLAIAGNDHSGRIIAWMGTAMFAALALGAPIGSALYAAGGFTAIAVATLILPAAMLVAVVPTRGEKPAPGAVSQASFMSVARVVWLPGLGAALSSIGYGAILSFGALHFAQQGWFPVWLPFTAYAGALIAARLVLGHLPDKLGGARVAAIFVVVEAAGLLLIWHAPGPALAIAGAALTGLGYSLVYPGLGAEAVRNLPADRRGLAMGLYTLCLDVAIGFGSPVLGAIAASTTLDSVFLASTVIVSCAAVVSMALARRSRNYISSSRSG